MARFFIIDETENTGKPYIYLVNCKPVNSGSEEGSIEFRTEDEAWDYIEAMRWDEWAGVEEYDEEEDFDEDEDFYEDES